MAPPAPGVVEWPFAKPAPSRPAPTGPAAIARRPRAAAIPAEPGDDKDARADGGRCGGDGGGGAGDRPERAPAVMLFKPGDDGLTSRARAGLGLAGAGQIGSWDFR